MTQDKSKSDYSYSPERSAQFREARSKSWFLGIGINDYLEFPKLSNAINDVMAIKDVMINRYGVAPEQCITLFNEHADEENLIQTLDELTEKVSKHDSLLIYFSGHGHLNKKTEMGFWIPQDAKKGKTASYIRNSTIRDYLKSISSLHTLLISDSCFSGSLFAQGAHRSSAALHELGSIQSRWAICSGRQDEEVYDGKPGEHSPFAQSILDTLRNNQTDLLNVAKLADRVTEQTHANNEQLPVGSPMQNVGHKGGQYIFKLKAKEDEIWDGVVREDKTSSYSQYLRKFPIGKHSEQAIARIKELEEEQSWQEAKARGTISAFHSYLTKFPDGEFSGLANDEIIKLEQAPVGFADFNPAPQPESTSVEPPKLEPRRQPTPEPRSKPHPEPRARPTPTPKPPQPSTPTKSGFRPLLALSYIGGTLLAVLVALMIIGFLISDVEMPQLVGQDIEMGRVALDELDLIVGQITYSEDGPTNKILYQSVAAGDYATYGDVVNFTVGAARGNFSLTALQTNLLKLGYNPGAIDGAMGAKTSSAIRAFQRAAGEVADGKGSVSLLNSTENALANNTLHNFLGCEPVTTTSQQPGSLQDCNYESSTAQNRIDVSYLHDCMMDVNMLLATGYSMAQIEAGCTSNTANLGGQHLYWLVMQCGGQVPAGATVLDIEDLSFDCSCSNLGCACDIQGQCLYEGVSYSQNCESTTGSSAVTETNLVCYCRDAAVSDRQCVTSTASLQGFMQP